MNVQLKRWLMGMMLILTTLLSVTSNAEQAVVSGEVVRHLSLTHHDFEKWTFTPKVSDKILITNNADISHSIYITYPDGSVVNLDVQLPGKTVTWVVPGPGDYVFQCWIHPIIRAEMTVSP